MNITFLIGNGFDVNLGLKTRYIQFYDYYQKHASNDSMILTWMREDNEEKKWADLELALGNKLNNISISDMDSFLDSLVELDRLLLDYLEIEEKKYSVDKQQKEILIEVERSLKNISQELPIDQKSSFDATCNGSINEEWRYCFITFNYTDILDQIIKMSNAVNLNLGSHMTSNGKSKKHIIGEVHHVHGSLTEGVVLAVNDASQINNAELKENAFFKSVFLKSEINKAMGQQRTERAEEIIDRSQIICIFGMSLGLTDKRWWEKIVSWMVAGGKRKLILYIRREEKALERKIPTVIIPVTERIKRDFWEKGKGRYEQAVYENIRNRIFVVFNSKIFSFPKIENP